MANSDEVDAILHRMNTKCVQAAAAHFRARSDVTSRTLHTILCVGKYFASLSLSLCNRFCCHQMCLFVTILLFSTLNCDPVKTNYSVCCSQLSALDVAVKDNERRTDVWWRCLLASHLVLHVPSQRTHTFNLHLPTKRGRKKKSANSKRCSLSKGAKELL